MRVVGWRLRLARAALHAKAKVSAYAARMDAYCGRMNNGLAAVAAVLGLILLATMAVQGAELTVAAVAPAAARGVPVTGWEY